VVVLDSAGEKSFRLVSEEPSSATQRQSPRRGRRAHTSPTTRLRAKEIGQYEHSESERTNNPPVGLVTPETNGVGKSGAYEYDPDLDPQLVWASKAEHTSFEVDTVSLYVHERIDPKTIIEAVRRDRGQKQLASFFSQPGENPPLRDAIEFCRHSHGWSNRLIAGDSLLVMNSLLEKEGMGGKVQMIYIDPPLVIQIPHDEKAFRRRVIQV
jgi:adenine-specific DNA-methyltransferase